MCDNLHFYSYCTLQLCGETLNKLIQLAGRFGRDVTTFPQACFASKYMNKFHADILLLIMLMHIVTLFMGGTMAFEITFECILKPNASGLKLNDIT